MADVVYLRSYDDRTRLDDEGLGAPEARLDGIACRRAVECAQDPRSREMCTGFPGAGASRLRRLDRLLDRGAGRLAVTEPELRLGHVCDVERHEKEVLKGARRTIENSRPAWCLRSRS